MKRMQEKRTMTGSKAPQTAALSLLALLLALLLLAAPSCADQMTIESHAYDVFVTSDSHIGSSYTINGISGISSIVAGEGETAVIRVTASLPSGWTLVPAHEGDAVFTLSGKTLTVQGIKSTIRVHLAAEGPGPTPKPHPVPSGGGGSVFPFIPVIPDVPEHPVVITETTEYYAGIPFYGTTVQNLSAVSEANMVYAAELSIRLGAAEAAGYPVVNSRGAPAVVFNETPEADVIPERFTRVYDISPLNPGDVITEVEIPVSMADIAASGLTWEDVNIYHYLGEFDLWIPLEILRITFDDKNYYYTAATDGASPFGVLIKHFEPAGLVPSPLPTPSPKSPAPLAGAVLGLLAAAGAGVFAAGTAGAAGTRSRRRRNSGRRP